MSAGIDEVEIKIEYNESFELDPLSDNFATSPIENDNFENNSTSNQEYKYKSRIEVDYSKFYIKKYDYESSGWNVDDKNEIIDDNQIETTAAENGKTWYKEIDKSGKYLCRFCDLSYSTVQTLRHHIKTKHPVDAKDLKTIIINNKRNSKLKCHICKQKFKLINDLKEHVKISHSIENVQASCRFCDAMFDTEKHMMEHLYLKHQKFSHTATYSCTICGYRTSKRSHYIQHNNTHLKEKNKKCQYCDYATNYLPNLKIHERIHTNYKPYVCEFKDCDYRCSAKSALRSHQLKHNPDKNMLYCDKCNYKTVYRQSLKKHSDSHKRNSIKVLF